ncbi:hypothetical protein T12_13844 [Trichinella patagoniensis]|uniref:Uncharacterized protein n=1 Tax=Trichinella patagoniensis TaxID=990121 RepID=A0A0V1AC09_9BILA|nr:hypothetical protein T12_13844 [Trichinella patagoniensis]
MPPYQYERANLEMMKRMGREVSDRLKFLKSAINMSTVSTDSCDIWKNVHTECISVFDLRSGD